MTPHRIVILGGGFGGLNTALRLHRYFNATDAYEIVLVDRHAEHLYTPLLYEVASGCLRDNGRLCRGALREGISIGFERFVAARDERLRLHPGEVLAVDSAKKCVRLKDQENLSYDTLVLAVGSATNYYGIIGLAEYAYPMKTLREAFRIRARLHDFLDHCAQGKEECLNIVIGGAGATGTELAAELAHFFQHLTRMGELQKGTWSVRLVEMGPQILGIFSDRVRQVASRRLKKLGVEVLTNTRIEEVKDRTIRLSTSSGVAETTEADIVVWCGGIQPSHVLKQSGLSLGPKGHVVVDEMFRVSGQEHIFALGDCAQFQNPRTKAFAPPLAQVAILEAEVLAQNIWRQLHHKSLRAWHPPRVWRTLLPLGGAYAVTQLGVLVMKGGFAYLLRRVVDFLYLRRLLPLRHALRMWVEGVGTYLQND